ncbi:DUF1707 SHOCT-like domain-containing protein [Agromyces bauzanensis]
MSAYANPDHPEVRLSNAERDEAVGHLAAAQAEGRLSEVEYGERVSAVRSAVTRGDLVPLFADLPGSAPAEQQVPVASAPITGYAAPDTYRETRRSRALGGRVGDTIMALTPFLATALFFLFGFYVNFAWSWLWFLIIPVTAIIIYGPGGGGRGSRD